MGSVRGLGTEAIGQGGRLGCVRSQENWRGGKGTTDERVETY